MNPGLCLRVPPCPDWVCTSVRGSCVCGHSSHMLRMFLCSYGCQWCLGAGNDRAAGDGTFRMMCCWGGRCRLGDEELRANQSQACLPAANLGAGALGEQVTVKKCRGEGEPPGYQHLCIKGSGAELVPELTVSHSSCPRPLDRSDSGLCLPFPVQAQASPLLRQDAGVLGWGE